MITMFDYINVLHIAKRAIELCDESRGPESGRSEDDWAWDNEVEVLRKCLELYEKQ